MDVAGVAGFLMRKKAVFEDPARGCRRFGRTRTDSCAAVGWFSGDDVGASIRGGALMINRKGVTRTPIGLE